ncbi:MFS transporter [Nocardia sp. NPDC050175]|uniref:MFS transporter n=1 Tax=Nocardia sp. NPDC050175 TaxID=3364317 RepID=UPI00378C6DF1
MSTATITPPGAARAGSDGPRRGAGLVLFMVCSAIFMLMLDATVVSATLADIRTDFNTSIDGLQWVIDAYAIPLAGVLLTFATVGDRYGRKRMFVIGMVVFTASSLALSLSETILQLNILRAVQGVGAAMLFATALPLLSVAFPDSAKRAKAIGIYGAVMAGASVAGPVLGGLLVTQFGWRSVFTINIPIGLLIIALAVLRMPESPRTPDRRTDWLGSLLLTGGLVAGVYGMTRGNALGWGSATILTLAALAVALLGLFLVWQFRTAHPLFDVSMLKKPGFAGTAIVSVAHMATLMAASNYLALFLINTLGYTPLQMGLRLLPISLAALVAAPLAAIYAKRIPIPIALPATMALVAIGMVLISGFEPGDAWTHFVPGMVIGGIGLGAITAITQAASLTFASTANAGMSSATFGTLRQVGMAIGVAGLGALLSHTAKDRAGTGFDALPQAGQIPAGLREQFVDGVGAGAGSSVVHALPPEFAGAATALTDTANSASIDGLNALANLGAGIGVVAVIGAGLAFTFGRRLARPVTQPV